MEQFTNTVRFALYMVVVILIQSWYRCIEYSLLV